MLALRKGRMEHMTNHGTGWVRMDYLVPARGLIGFRTEFITETRGTGIDAPRLRPLGAVGGGDAHARRGGPSPTAAARPCLRADEPAGAGHLFVGPGEEVYEGMIVGENARSEDIDVNPVKEKHLTNMRSSTSDVLERLIPHRKLTLDQAMECVREDECVEVTPAERAHAQGGAG